MAADESNEALLRIRQLAASANKGSDTHPAPAEQGDAAPGVEIGCVVRSLPDRLQVDAAGVAAAVNPVNAPQGLMQFAHAMRGGSLSLVLAVGKYFGPAPRTLTVSFLEETPQDLRDRIIAHMNAWTGCCGIGFAFTTGVGQVRISRAGAGFWSYLGTDILLIPKTKPTMNLQGFSMETPESEYKRVVRHETGHTLGFPHEHMRKELIEGIDHEKAYAYFKKTYNWDKPQVDTQVLTPLNQASLMGTPADQTSIMCYQLPGSIMMDGKPIAGGIDINPTDCGFAGKVYPRSAKPAKQAKPAKSAKGKKKDKPQAAPRFGGHWTSLVGPSQPSYEDIALDWPAHEDVDVAAAIAEA